MGNTTHIACRQLVALFVAHGVRQVVLSPGSRNAPLLIAFSREKAIEHYVVVDERVAAFMALGMATRSGSPVALVCTSGTALLNYAPAVAEAYYRHIPLLVVSADRPEEWIDQDDSQTIRQAGALSHFVKASYHIPSYGIANAWYAHRQINDALLQATTPCCGPVHINIPLSDPLCAVDEINDNKPVRIESLGAAQQLSVSDIQQLANEISSSSRIMILATIASPSPQLQEALNILSQLPQIVVLTESVANLKGERFIPTIDRVLTVIDNREKVQYAPDLLITLGGAPVSRMIKEFLRSYSPISHWRIGHEEHLIDTMQCLTRKITIEPASLMLQLSTLCLPAQSTYSQLWHEKESIATCMHNKIVNSVTWCDLRAFSIILPQIPQNYILHLSNGTSIRYAQLFDTPQVAASYCNRGVSGIDGSTSTALGAHLADNSMHLLITGDMSFGYDAGGLATGYASPRLKIIVMDNGGGGIFRFIKGPSDLPELEECFEVHRQQPIEGYAKLHGFKYFHACDEKTLCETLPQFFTENIQPAILAVSTPHKINAQVLRAYMRRARE